MTIHREPNQDELAADLQDCICSGLQEIETTHNGEEIRCTINWEGETQILVNGRRFVVELREIL